MVDEQLTFLSWSRERLADLAGVTVAGRAQSTTLVTLTGRGPSGATTSTATRQLTFLLAGPADVVGLKPGAVRRRYPAPGAIDHETNRCPYVELAEPTLPWRYSPAGNPTGGHLRPWLALVVGTEPDELRLTTDTVTLSPTVLDAHPLGSHFAHVQVDTAGRRTARVLSARPPLQTETDYVAVLVPAFAPNGDPAWPAVATGAVTLPCYDAWRFRTAAPAGSFDDLAARLQPGAADPTTGRAPVDYPRVPAAGDLEIRGALAPLGEVDAALPTQIGSDLAGLRTAGTDDAGRPVLGLPRYGDAWVGDPEGTDWGAELNGDPRHRGTAGLGAELGILLQEELAAEAGAQAGALAEARQRIRDLVLGLVVSGSLWERRLPADPQRRLWVLGPALRRTVTDDGVVAERATADDRALPRGLFSTAARRILRPGPARTALLEGGAPDPRQTLTAANRCPEPPRATEDGVVFSELGLDDFDDRRRETAERGQIDAERLLVYVQELADEAHERLRDRAEQLLQQVEDALGDGRGVPWVQVLTLLAAAASLPEEADDETVERLRRELVELLERFGQLGRREDDPLDLLRDFEEPEAEEPPCRPVDLDALADGVAAAFDPRGPAGPARVRVLATIDGLDPARPLAPPEPCIGLDRPVWSDLDAAMKEWLLPGVGRLPDDTVIAVETNPVFVDALLTGMNHQLLAELRWRNLPIASGCTPLRTFWDRTDPATGGRVDDILGVADWPATGALGDPAHRPGAASGRDLVVVVKAALFRRYPATIVYLTTAVHGGSADFSVDPPAGAARIFPDLQGRIGEGVVFFGFSGFAPEEITRYWLVLEEPPSGYRFGNDRVAAATLPTLDGGSFASQAFEQPVRVLIRGDKLDPEGPP